VGWRRWRHAEGGCDATEICRTCPQGGGRCAPSGTAVLWLRGPLSCHTPAGPWFCGSEREPRDGAPRRAGRLSTVPPQAVPELSTGEEVIVHRSAPDTACWGGGPGGPLGVVSCLAGPPWPSANDRCVVTPARSPCGVIRPARHRNPRK